MLQRAFGKVNAGVHLAVIAPRSLHCKVAFFINEQDIELVFGQLSGNARARDTAADYHNIGLCAVQRLISYFGQAHFGNGRARKADIVDNMKPVLFVGSRRADRYYFVPIRAFSADGAYSVLFFNGKSAAEVFVQLFAK